MWLYCLLFIVEIYWEMTSSACVSTASKRVKVLYDFHGTSDYIGESISITEHSLQAAYFSNRDNPNDNEIVIACLLHDIGHVLGMEAGMDLEMDGCGINDHEKIGGDFLRKLNFPERIAKLVQSHVQAKRYLCAKDPEYYSQLSEASKTTLKFQGGVMSSEEMTNFEQDPDFQTILNMRKYDEAAKVVDFMHSIPTFDHYLPIIDEIILKNTTTTSTSTDFIPSNPNAYLLSSQQIEVYKKNSCLKISNLLAFESLKVSDVAQWSDEICAWPKSDYKW
jgi:putative nucleotidyltransferase with HDIG domain